jgi:hypothetical protein
MPRFIQKLFSIVAFLAIATIVNAQSNSIYLKQNAIAVEDPFHLDDSVYNLLHSYSLIMVGEMHGSKESAQLVTGFAKMFSLKGDSVSVGMEIPSEQLSAFLSSRTDSSIYQSKFFSDNPVQDGRNSFAWARLISKLKKDQQIELFFFDVNEDEKKFDRDSMMAVKIEKQIQLHPGWKTITLSGNVHVHLSAEEKKAGSYLYNGMDVKSRPTVLTIGHYYQEGSCYGDFGHGLEEKQLGRPANDFDTALSFDKYLLKLTSRTSFPYQMIYYTKKISPSPSVMNHLDLRSIKQELIAIHERDQKTRAHGDSAEFMHYIDSCNLARVETLVHDYGWMGKSMIGGYCNYTLWLVVQHAELPIQEKYLPMLEESVADSESRGSELAMLQDRVLMRQGKKQLYGSQVVMNKSGGQEFYPIEDEKNVNARRKSVGLQPMEEYAKFFGINYPSIK